MRGWPRRHASTSVFHASICIHTRFFTTPRAAPGGGGGRHAGGGGRGRPARGRQAARGGGRARARGRAPARADAGALSRPCGGCARMHMARWGRVGRCRSAPGRAPGAAAGRRGGSTLSPGWHAQPDTTFRETATVCVDDAHAPASPCMHVGPARQQTGACDLSGASAACRARGRCTRSHQPPVRRAAPRRCRWC